MYDRVSWRIVTQKRLARTQQLPAIVTSTVHQALIHWTFNITKRTSNIHLTVITNRWSIPHWKSKPNRIQALWTTIKIIQKACIYVQILSTKHGCWNRRLEHRLISLVVMNKSTLRKGLAFTKPTHRSIRLR